MIALSIPRPPTPADLRRRHRVLHVLEPAGAGVPAYATALAAAQVRRGHDVTVLAHVDLDPVYRTEDDGGWVRRAWEPRRWGVGELVRARAALRAAVAEVRPDVVHLHSFYAGLAGRVGARPDAMVVHQPHAWPFARAGRGAVVAQGIERWLAPRADVVVTVSDAEAREGREAGIDRPAVTSAVPVDLAAHHPVDAAGRAAARVALDVPEQAPVAVCVGRVCHQKGQDRLLAAWARHRTTVDRLGARLVLVGPGDADQVAAWAGAELGRSVAHVGGVDDVRPWLAAADVLVQPSRWEGMSMAVAEGLASGLPVVATDVAGMGEMVGVGGLTAGAVVPPEAVVLELLLRLGDPSLRHREAIEARRRAERLFDVDEVAARVDVAYGLGVAGMRR